jgi:uronate dehydrogenase
VSKAFGENLARLYADKAAMDIACLRWSRSEQASGAAQSLDLAQRSRPVPPSRRVPRLAAIRLFHYLRHLEQPPELVDNSKSAVQYRPMDDAEYHVSQIMPDGDTRDPEDPGVKFHGGPFVALALGQRLQ